MSKYGRRLRKEPTLYSDVDWPAWVAWVAWVGIGILAGYSLFNWWTG